MMGSDFPPEGKNNRHVIEVWCSPSVMKKDGIGILKNTISPSLIQLRLGVEKGGEAIFEV